MKHAVHIPETVWNRWLSYRAANRAWSFDELVKQLLIEHFRQADAMEESIRKQEAERKRI